MTNSRKVEIISYVWSNKRQMNDTVVDAVGTWHGWGIDHEEYESGPGSYTAGIVEMPDGSVQLVHATRLRFKEPTR